MKQKNDDLLKLKLMNLQILTGEYIEHLITQLQSSDKSVRSKARKLLVKIGKPAIIALARVLQYSKFYKARWEAAKALGEINNVTAIPALVKALEDTESDVVWLAAEALIKFKKTAWPEILNALINAGSESRMFSSGAHHIFRKQREEGFNDLLEILRKTLETGAVQENKLIAASNLIKRMRDVQSQLK